MSKLTKVQEAALNYIPEANREAAKAKMLEDNAKRDIVVTANRKDFSVTLNAKGNVVIRGLGNRFPVGMRPDSLRTLLAHVEELNKFASTLPVAAAK